MGLQCGTMLLSIVLAATANVAFALAPPDLMATGDGQRVSSVREWENVRRPEILETFRREVYGRRPVERPDFLRFERECADSVAMDGEAVRMRIRATYGGAYGTNSFTFTAFVPRRADRPVPAFLYICISRTPWKIIDPTRTVRSGRWPAEEIVRRGFAAIAFASGDVAPDRFDGFATGVYAAFEHPDKKVVTPWGATWGTRTDESWGAISAWAWGASRVMDWIETEPSIDAAHVGVVGLSRGGKASLWAGATDERFAMTCVHASGQCGAKLRTFEGSPYGQTVEDITRRFPHWFCWRFHRWMGKDLEMPFDQHWVLALVAPRLLYVSNASGDVHAPEYAACIAASPAWELYGGKGFVSDGMPAFDVAQDEGRLAFHHHDGPHDLTPEEWKAYMDYAEKNGWKRAK